MSRLSVTHILKKWRLAPDTVRGQHFLIDDTVLERIVAIAGVNRRDMILEVGPGIANLTSLLALKAGRVVSVEVDRSFQPLLDAFSAVNTNVQVLYADILRTPFGALQTAFHDTENYPYKVVANIPYYLTSRFFATVFQYPILPQMMVVLIQKEVAERIVASPGDHSKLSLSIQFYGSPRIALSVSKKAFYPAPEVDSAVLVIEHIAPWAFPEDEKVVWRLIAFGFSAKRKKLANNLAAGLQVPREKVLGMMRAAAVDEGVRAEDLTPDQWRSLARIVKSGSVGEGR